MSVMWPDPFRSFLALDLTDSAHLSPSTCWRSVFQFNAFPASTDSPRWALLTRFIYWNKKIRSKSIFFLAQGTGSLLTCLTCCHFLEGETRLRDRITVRRKTGEQQGGGYNKDKGPLAAADRKLLEVGGEANCHPNFCSAVEHECGSSVLSQAWWKCKKTLPFTLTETWGKETWGLLYTK